MKFVHPNILYFLLLLVIPIIIHLFNFRRYKKLYFSSIQFIKKVEKETNSTRNLKHLIILLTRLLALAALIFAFAQPYRPTASENDTLKNSVPIYLDNSFSMSAKGNNGDLLNQAKEAVLQIVESYPKEQRYLLVTNELNSSELRPITESELKDRLDDIQLSPITRSIVNPIESIDDYFKSHSADDGAHHYYIISDFQQHILDKNEAKVDSNSNYSLLQMKTQINRNLYIDSVWFEQPFQRIGVNNTLNVRIQNTGKEKLTNVEVNLNVGDIKRQILADLEANNETILSINYTNKTTGIKHGVVEILDENLFFDNRFYFSYTVKEFIDVLIIKDDNSLPYPRLVFETDDYYKVHEISINQLKTEELTQADLIILNGIKSISSGIHTQIKQLVNNGIHLFIIPAVEFDKASYNNLLSTFQMPLFHEIGKQEIRIGKINTADDFFTGMFDKKVDNLRMPPLKNYLLSTVYTQANFSSLIQYENGMPLLAKQASSANVYVLYTPIHPEFNNFGKTALFASTLLRIGENAQGKQPLYLIIGSSEDYKVRTQKGGDYPIELKQDNIAFIPEISNHTNFSSISVRHSIDNQAISDGIYTITKNDEELGKLALNYNRLESDMNYANEKEILSYFKSLGMVNINLESISTLSDIQHLTIKKPNDFWRILLILALTFFLIEMAIIIFWKV